MALLFTALVVVLVSFLLGFVFSRTDTMALATLAAVLGTIVFFIRRGSDSDESES